MNFYRICSGIIEALDSRKASLPNLLNSIDEPQRKRAAALVLESLSHRQLLSEVIQVSSLLVQEKRLLTPTLALVLVHDLILNRGGIQAPIGPLKQAIFRHKTRLKAEWIKANLRARSTETGDTLNARGITIHASKYRFIRVNTLIWSLDEALEHYKSRGFSLLQPGDTAPLIKSCFFVDDHVDNLLCFHGGTSFEDDPAYLAGRSIIQDKASCFPAVVLSPPLGANVIDATSAPGNKTSHLSALMNNSGQIFAFERDPSRFAILRRTLKKAVCSNVVAECRDFLATNPEEPRFSRVTHILLDPSCSGSGIANRIERTDRSDDEEDGERLARLSSFQLRMIRHAMKFPASKRIVYSTCSVHVEENENVALAALASPGGNRQWELAPEKTVIPQWPRRGLQVGFDHNGHRRMVRCSKEDGTNGFFVCCFVRTDSRTEDNLDPSVEAKHRRRRKAQVAQQEGSPGHAEDIEWHGLQNS